MKRLLGSPLILSVLLVATLSAQPGGQDEWWPEDVTSANFRDGYNLRVPLRVGPAPVAGYPAGTPVQVHLDLGREAIEAGWISQENKPASFTLDSASVRLVQYSHQWNAILETAGEATLPVTVHQGWLEPDQTNGHYGRVEGVFDTQDNAVVTLEWVLPSALGPFQSTYYYVYFDIEENCAGGVCTRTPPAVPEAKQALLDALYWSGAGQRLFGHHPPSNSLAPTLQVIGTRDATTVWVYSYGQNTFPVLDNSGLNSGLGNPFVLGRGETRAWSFGAGQDGTHFMVEADKPVIALTQAGAGSGEFVPSSQGALAGRHFFVPPGSGALQLIAPPNGGALGSALSFTTTNLSGSGECADKVFPNDPQRFWCPLVRQDASKVATITVAGQDVLVQHEPPPGQKTWSQPPTSFGGPTGTDYLVSTRPTQSGGFGLVVSQGGQVEVRDCRSTSCQYDQTFPVPAGSHPSFVSGQGMFSQGNWPSTTPAPTAPMHVGTAGSPLRVLAGARTDGTPAMQSTPFGGEGGRVFTVQTPMLLQAFYDDTEVTIDTGSGTPTVVSLSATEAHAVCAGAFPACSTNRPDETAASVRSDKPISVFPLARPGDDYRRYLPAEPMFVMPAIEPSSYRGYLVDVRPMQGRGPVFYEAIPQQTVRIPFLAQNLGMWDGEALQDTIRFTATSEPAGVLGPVAFQTPELLLPTHTPAATYADVTVLSDAPIDGQVTVTIDGQSKNNNDMRRSFSAVLFLRQSFDVNLAWSQNNMKVLDRAFPPTDGVETFHEVPFRLENTGTGQDSFVVSVDKAFLSGGWDAEVRLDGQPVTVVGPLAAGETIDLDLRIRLPQTTQVANVFMDVIAKSTEDGLKPAGGTVSHTIRLHAEIAFEDSLAITVEESLVRSLPGHTALFVARLTNTAEDGASTVILQLIKSLPPGWSARIVGGLGSTESGGIFLQAGRSIEVPVEVMVPADAAAHSLATSLLRAETTDGIDGAAASAAFTVQVLPVQNVTLSGPDNLFAEPGETITIPLQVGNLGNGAQRIQIRAVAPGGWNVTLPAPFEMAAGATGAVDLQVTVPEHALAGSVELVVSAEAAGTKISHPLSVGVQTIHDLSWAPVTALRARPGDLVEGQVVVQNAGNGVETIAVTASAGNWGPVTVGPTSLDVPPGATRLVSFQWTAPATAQGPIVINLQARSAGTTASVAVTVNVTTPSVTLAHVIMDDSAPKPGEVAFVTALLHNPAATTARHVEVRLVAKERTLDSVHFDAVGPNGSVVAPLRWVGAQDTAAPYLVWGLELDGAFLELGRAPLRENLQAAPLSEEAPAGMTVGVTLAVSVLLAARRRDWGAS